MRTDTKGLLDAGLALGTALVGGRRAPSSTGPTWTATSPTRCPACTPGRCAGPSDIDPARVPLTFPTRGNMGPAAVPFTLAMQADSLQAGDRVLLMGIGSGPERVFAEMIW